MSKNVKKVTPPAEPKQDDAPTTAQAATSTTPPADQTPPQGEKKKPTVISKEKAAKIKAADGQPDAETQAQIDEAANAEPPSVGPVEGLKAGMENPPLHLLNRQYIKQDEERRAADPLAGMETLIGERAKQKLLRRLPEAEAAAERERLAKNHPRHRVDR